MAIGGYYDVYTVPEYQERVNNIGNSIGSLENGYFYFQAKRNVQNQIEVLKQKEKSIFKILGVKDLNELNKRLENYKNAVLNLSGANLNDAFLEVLRWRSEKEYYAFEEAVISIIEEEMGEGKPINEYETKQIRNKVLNLLSEQFGDIPYVRFSSPQGMQDNESVNPAKFTKEQKNRWKLLLRERFGENEKARKYNILVEANDTSIKGEFTWYGITEKLTATEAKELFKNDSEGLLEINNKMKDLILSKVNNDYDLISQIITYIFNQDPYVFFVGNNLNEITGILGEIQGLYYLSKFLGDNFFKVLQWKGGLIDPKTGKKYHQDILLENFGIQVKNTSKNELFGNISFSEANLSTMLNKINLSQQAELLLYNFYPTLNFNVEYKRKGINRYEPGIRITDKGAREFVDAHAQLQQYSDDIDRLLGLFAATYMYIDVGEDGQRLDANVLYLLSGSMFETASNILISVLHDIEAQENHFHMTLNSKGSKNIIDALNNGVKGQTFSNFVVDDIKLTSSYVF